MSSAVTSDVLDALADGVVVAGPDQRVTLVNARAARMLGRPREELVGLPLAQALMLLDQDGNGWFASTSPYTGLGTRTGVPEQSWLLPSGLEVLVVARIERPRPSAPVERVVVSIRDGRGRERLDRERSDLVATVAHELRSPLTGVKGFVQALLARWDLLSDDQRKLMLETVSTDADRLARLIAELLDVARIDTGRLQLAPRESDAAVLVGRVVASVSAGTSRTIELAAPDGLPLVFADPDKLTQVVTNLVENAVRHGSGVVRVALDEHAEEDHPGVRIVVDDEGEGIPEAMRRRVFTKIWTHGERGGSGLGMYIVVGLARAHGGSVAIGDAPAGGARITVWWPCEDRRS